jgi:hypothetical protein
MRRRFALALPLPNIRKSQNLPKTWVTRQKATERRKPNYEAAAKTHLRAMEQRAMRGAARTGEAASDAQYRTKCRPPGVRAHVRQDLSWTGPSCSHGSYVAVKHLFFPPYFFGQSPVGTVHRGVLERRPRSLSLNLSPLSSRLSWNAPAPSPRASLTASQTACIKGLRLGALGQGNSCGLSL